MFLIPGIMKTFFAFTVIRNILMKIISDFLTFLISLQHFLEMLKAIKK